jgi:hypothetical protein
MRCWHPVDHPSDNLRERCAVLAPCVRKHHHFRVDCSAEPQGEPIRIGTPGASAMVRKDENSCSGLKVLGQQILKADAIKVARQEHLRSAMCNDLHNC